MTSKPVLSTVDPIQSILSKEYALLTIASAGV